MLKYLRYQRQIRENQINRAIKQANSKQKGRKNNPNDPARFITEKHFTENGVKGKKQVDEEVHHHRKWRESR